MAGMRVRRLIMMGTSQSSGTLRGYLPAHAAWRMPDGKPIFDGFLATSTAGIRDYLTAFEVPPAEAVQCLNPAFELS